MIDSHLKRKYEDLDHHRKKHKNKRESEFLKLVTAIPKLTSALSLKANFGRCFIVQFCDAIEFYQACLNAPFVFVSLGGKQCNVHPGLLVLPYRIQPQSWDETNEFIISWDIFL